MLGFQTLPFAAYAVLSRRPSTGAKIVVAATACPLVGALLYFQRSEVALAVLCGLAYYSLFSLAIFHVAKFYEAGRLTAGAVFVAALGGGLVIPSVTLPTVALSFGWERMLASYSYCMDRRRVACTGTLMECLVFMLVNPTVVFGSRGQMARAGLHPAALRRAFLGVLALVLSAVWLRPLTHSVRLHLSSWNDIGTIAACGALQFGSDYALHSGRASLQLGLMRQMGHVLPERYRYPFLASGPQDFWRRWNTYVGGWLHAYVFAPSVRRHPRRSAAGIVAGLVALVASGLLHDVYSYFKYFTVNCRFTLFFLAMFLLAVLWQGAGRAWQRAIILTGGTGRLLRSGGSVLSWACFASFIVAAAALWGTG
jgi:D-alanyl-lipoteichoic acid acyltransferase DltB (MBOAT superfamily)